MSPHGLSGRLEARPEPRFAGQTGRTGHPSVRAELFPRSGDADIRNAVTFLPKTTFVDAANVSGVCTREEFAEDACPKERFLV